MELIQPVHPVQNILSQLFSKAIRQYGFLIFWIFALLIFAAAWYMGRYGADFGRILPSITGNKESGSVFTDKFGRSYSVDETGKRVESSDAKWWVNSGGRMIVSGGVGRTIFGNLPSSDKWEKNYSKTNPEDTDNGRHPQNIFRLVGRDKYQNFSQEVFFRINKMNFSSSDNRNESNGFLLFNRYQNGDNLYYTGLRVDGYSVIKKKIDGDYHTLDERKIFSGTYNHKSNPNLIPVGRWMGIRSVVKTQDDGDVEISLYWKPRRTARNWQLIAHYVDKGQKGDKIEKEGYGGIRTDFMDVEFDNYKIYAL